MCYTPPIHSAQSMVSRRFGQLYGSTYKANQSAMLFSNRNFASLSCTSVQQTNKCLKSVNIIRDTAFSHMAVSKGFLSTPGIVTWHKISEHMCPNCAPSNSSTVTLGLVPSPSSIFATWFSQITPEWFCLSHQ